MRHPLKKLNNVIRAARKKRLYVENETYPINDSYWMQLRRFIEYDPVIAKYIWRNPDDKETLLVFLRCSTHERRSLSKSILFKDIGDRVSNKFADKNDNDNNNNNDRPTIFFDIDKDIINAQRQLSSSYHRDIETGHIDTDRITVNEAKLNVLMQKREAIANKDRQKKAPNPSYCTM